MDYIIDVIAPPLAFFLLTLLVAVISNCWLAFATLAAALLLGLYRPDFSSLFNSVTVWSLVIAIYFAAHCFDKDVRALRGPAGRKTSWLKMLPVEYASFRAWAREKAGFTAARRL